MTLGEKIQKHRKQNKYSQEKIAEVLGISRQAVTKWETSQSAPSTENLLKLAEFFGISVDELVSDKTVEMEEGSSKRAGSKWQKIAVIIWAVTIIALMVILIFPDGIDAFGIIELYIIFNILCAEVFVYVIYIMIKALKVYISKNSNSDYIPSKEKTPKYHGKLFAGVIILTVSIWMLLRIAQFVKFQIYVYNNENVVSCETQADADKAKAIFDENSIEYKVLDNSKKLKMQNEEDIPVATKLLMEDQIGFSYRIFED